MPNVCRETRIGDRICVSLIGKVTEIVFDGLGIKYYITNDKNECSIIRNPENVERLEG